MGVDGAAQQQSAVDVPARQEKAPTKARRRIRELQHKVGQPQLHLDLFPEALRHVEEDQRRSSALGETGSSKSSRRWRLAYRRATSKWIECAGSLASAARVITGTGWIRPLRWAETGLRDLIQRTALTLSDERRVFPTPPAPGRHPDATRTSVKRASRAVCI